MNDTYLESESYVHTLETTDTIPRAGLVFIPINAIQAGSVLTNSIILRYCSEFPPGGTALKSDKASH